MDLMRLDMADWLPDGTLIEGYTSLIWTERYQEPGDFELKTYDIDRTRLLLPEGALLALRDSREVMLVETHSITMTTEGKQLTVTGRTMDCIFDHRVITEHYYKNKRMTKRYLPHDAALVLMWNSIDNNSGEDVLHYGYTNTGTYTSLMKMPPSDSLPRCAVIDGTDSPYGTLHWRYLIAGPATPMLLKFLRRARCGIRIRRPPHGAGSGVVSVNATIGVNKGTITKGTWVTSNSIFFEVYNGVNRSANQTDRPAVIFDYASGHIENPEHLTSIKDEKNCMVTTVDFEGSGTWYVYRDGVAKTGLDLRIGYFVIPGSSHPDPATQDEENNAANMNKDEYGHEELDNVRRVKFFSGQVSTESQYKRGTHYDLGDRVTLQGEYGFDDVMRVVEYVRVEDQEGERGYPGLAVSLPEA